MRWIPSYCQVHTSTHVSVSSEILVIIDCTHYLYLSFTHCLVGEEDEVSIKEAADTVIEAFGFKGEVVVSFYPFSYIAVVLNTV